jgi:hypothetical protein
MIYEQGGVLVASSGNQRRRVVDAWNILVRERRILTYGELAAKLRTEEYRPLARSMGFLLTPIMNYCRDHGLPPLNDLVVGKESGRPNYAPAGYDYRESQRKVLAFDWSAVEVDDRDFATRG